MQLVSAEGILGFLREPAFVLDAGGLVLAANAAAHRAAGSAPVGRALADLTEPDGTDLALYLRRCTGTTAPLIGTLTLRRASGPPERWRTYGARIAGGGDAVRIALRCEPAAAGEFSVLARKVRELNAEIRERRSTQARLEETLLGNEILLRELHHRVKNNIQMLLGLFSAAERESSSAEVRSFIHDARQRLV
ncbi:MAG: histidine kinase dimerization/phosphoacceptor domain -containing protein, partial [Alphaproteobacteria bacterium]